MTPTKKSKVDGDLHFTKMTGAGNDFLIFDAREKSFPKFDRALFTKSLCRRALSIGADGVVFVEKTKVPHAAFKWDFYNADGSHAEMCGNAARCVARYAVAKELSDNNMSFETAAGIIKAKVRASGVVEVEMPAPEIIREDLEVPVGEHLKIKVLYVNTGVPHAVKEEDDWSEEHLTEMGSYIRNRQEFFGTNGANVTFFEVVEKSILHSATFERGVEAVTLACGTGAVAAAVAASLKGIASPFEVRVPGGTLHVEVDKNLKSVILAGEARFICEGTLMPEALL
jgi:diaminopimelate epimerase